MRVMSLHTEHGSKTVVMGEPGRKWTPFVIIEYPVRLKRIKNADVDRYAREINYPAKKAVREFRRIGRKNGITKGALTLLKGA